MTIRLQPPRSGVRPARRSLQILFVMSLQVLAFGSFGLAQKPEQQARQQMRFGSEMAQRGLWNEALFRFQRALELRPEDATIYNNLAVAYEALGLFDEALDHYRQGLRRSPSDKALKRNYARFVEFYQRYRPEEEDGEQEPPAAANDTEPSDGAEATPESGGP